MISKRNTFHLERGIRKDASSSVERYLNNLFVKHTLLITLVIFILACSDKTKTKTTTIQPTSGIWQLNFQIVDSTGTITIPARLELDSTFNMTLINGEERIALSNFQKTGDSIVVRIEPYLSTLHFKLVHSDSLNGYWQDESREHYKIAFYGHPARNQELYLPDWKEKIYDATFSYDCTDCAYKTVGVFQTEDGLLSGTFLTESGDYRYLQGLAREDGTFFLSCFDGAHLFYFTGTMAGDSIQDGMFYSGKHHHEKWNAVQNSSARLRDPDSLTYLKEGVTSLEFTVKNTAGDSIHFGNENYLNKVTVVQILGTWCPNCTDETRFWKSIAASLGEDVQVIPVAFERGSDFSKHVRAVENYKKQFDLPYEVYIGGEVNKSTAAKVFSDLNAIMSYPTSIIIDKQGRVRKIHTGFYGPSTGKYHTLYTERLRNEVEKLLNM